MSNAMTVEIKNVYGNVKIYPACPIAEGFSKLIKQKTFTDRDIKCIKDLGYQVKVQSSYPATL